MIEFTKMHGLGNDYIYINTLNNKNIIPKNKLPAIIRYLSNRNFGIGSDGVIFIKKSKIADFKMEIYNSDGSQAEMCGNGIRCFSKYIYDKQLSHKKELTIETLAGIKKTKLEIKNNIISNITVNMGSPIWDLEKIPLNIPNHLSKKEITFNLDDIKIKGYAVSIGNPHFIIFSSNIDKINLEIYGPKIECFPLFPQKTNVEFIEILGNTSIKARVWERGSGETFACGTGATASFSVANMLGYVKDYSTVYLKGGELNIRKIPSSSDLELSGIATYVYDGKIPINYNYF